jgi:hypothetical protein
MTLPPKTPPQQNPAEQQMVEELRKISFSLKEIRDQLSAIARAVSSVGAHR